MTNLKTRLVLVLGFCGLAFLNHSTGTVRADELDAGLWTLKVDPPTTLPVAPTAKSMTIPFPGNFGGGGDTVYPSTPSNFVLIGKNTFENDVRQVWDLSTRKLVGAIRGRGLDDKVIALSSDGAYLAGKTSKTIDVRATKTGRVVQTFLLESPFEDFVDFADNDRVIFGRIQDKRLQVCDIKSRDKVCDVLLVKEADKEAIAISPGRKYLALSSWQDGTLRVYDLTDGQLVGEAATPKKNGSKIRCFGLGFSPDGTELAGLYEYFGEYRVVFWSVADGKMLANFDLGKEIQRPAFYESRGIEWFPDKSAILILGHAVVDRASGKKVWTLPYDGQNLKVSPRHFLDNQTVMVVSFQPSMSLRSEVVPRDKIASAVQIVRAGGNAADASLPQVVAADLAGAKQIDYRGKPGSWAVAMKGEKPAPRRLTARPITMKGKADEMRAILFPSQDSSQVFVVGTPQQFGQANPTDGQVRWVERFDLAGGKGFKKVDLPNVVDPIAVSPDASTLLLREVRTKDRIDAVSALDAKPIAGWRPFEKETADGKAVAWAAFLDADKVLAVSNGGTLALWSLPKCKALYIADDAFVGSPVLSPDRTLVAGYDGKGLRVIEAATGTRQGEAAAPTGLGNRAEMKAAAFRPDGQELIGLFQNATIVRWDLKTGKLISQFSVAGAAFGNSIEWSGSDHILLDNRLVVDLNTKRVVWEYVGGQVGASGPDGRHWFVAIGLAGQEASRLVSIESPEPGLEKAEALLANPKTPAMLRPGDKVSLQLNFNGPPRNAPAYKTGVAEAIGSRLKQNGLTVVEDGQPNRRPGPVRVSFSPSASASALKLADAPDVRFVVHVQEKDTGKSIQYQRIGRARGDVQVVKLVDLVCEISLVDATGPVTWMPPYEIMMQPFGSVLRLPAGETDPEIYLKTIQWDKVKSWASNASLPYFVVRNGNEVIRLPGWSNLNQEFAR